MSTQARRVFRLTSAYCWCIPKRGGTSCARVCRPLPSCGGGLAARTRAPVRALRRGCANSPRDPQRRTIANAPAQKAARTFLSQSSVLSCRVRVRRANSGRAALLAQRTTRPPPHQMTRSGLAERRGGRTAHVRQFVRARRREWQELAAFWRPRAKATGSAMADPAIMPLLTLRSNHAMTVIVCIIIFATTLLMNRNDS